MSASNYPIAQYLLRWSARALLFLFMILLLVFTLLPLGVRLGVQHWFAQQGVDVQLQHVSIAPVVGRLQLSGLKGTRDGERVLQLDDLIVDIRWLPLRQNLLELSELSVKGLFVQADKIEQQQWVAGLNLARLTSPGGASSGSLEPRQAEGSLDPQQAEGSSSDRPVNGTPWQIKLHRLVLDNIDVCASASKNQQPLADVCVSVEKLSVPQMLSLLLTEQPEISLPLAQLQQFSVRDQLNDRALVGLQSFELQQLLVQQQQLSIASVSLASLDVLARQASESMAEQQPYHASLGRMELRSFDHALDKAVTALGSFDVSSMNVLVHRDSSGGLPIQKRLEEVQNAVAGLIGRDDSEDPESPDPETSVSKEPAATFSLAELSLGEGSQIYWLDEGVNPAVKQPLGNIQLTLEGLDTRAPQKPTQVNFAVALDDFSSARLKGWVKPFTEKINMQLDVVIEGFDAQPVSPYVERNLQYKILQGHINEKLTVAIREDQLDIVSELILDKFYIESLAKEELAEGEESQNLPVAMALDLLRDGDDRITVEIPIDGDIRDPNFSIAQVLGVVFRKALTQAVVNYYTPFGLVNIASTVAGSALKLRFDPLLFKSGTDHLDEEQKRRLKKLAELLTSKKKLKLSFCPKVTAKDAMAQLQLKEIPKDGLQLVEEDRKRLMLLGRERGVLIKRLLLKDQVEAIQVILCQSELDLTEHKDPEVSVQL